ncbi:MAG: PSD1 and planctomycete cytochrome C domain-containing protein, partial [Verrucomicrobiota bacterium]
MIAFLVLGSAGWSTGATGLEAIEFFESRIRPILAQECYECHRTGGKVKGGLVLDHRAGLLEGGDSGPAIIPGNPDESLLLQAMRHELEDLKMPKAGAKLEEDILSDFEKWIASGAPDPRDHPPTDEEVADDKAWPAIMERRKQWWSFQPITPPELPEVQSSDHPVDRFVDARMAEAGLEPAPLADPRVLVRRLSYALTGLPLTPEQIEVADRAIKVKGIGWLVDSLMSQPQFGEKWARHWMDWIRYAESHGSEGDPDIGNAHHYRDYLIRALNEDIPYDQLVREHIAGDLMENPRTNSELGVNESLIGTAHWRMVQHGFTPTDPLEERVRFNDDKINVFSKAFLGLTVSCARCHDHKFDAISHDDYYALYGIFSSTRPSRAVIDLDKNSRSTRYLLEELKPGIRKRLAKDWLASVESVTERLAALPRSPEGKLDKNTLKWLWNSLETQGGRRLLTNDSENETEFVMAWDLRDPEEQSKWFSEGLGLSRGFVQAGEFAVSVDEVKALSGVFPAGVYSHLISTKDPARLTSTDFDLDDEYDLWLLVSGSGNANVRYVVENYPRKGTVYKIAELKTDGKSGSPEWRWQKFDLSYWKGDSIHIELTTARDGAVEIRNSDRSWFGIREARLTRKGAPAPQLKPLHFDPVLESFAQTVDGKNRKADAFRLAIRSAINDWKSGRVIDAQAELLQQLLREGLLPNELSALPTAAPVIEKYRELEASLPVPTRIPALAEWRGQDHPLYDRGDHKQPAHLVSRRFLEAIDPEPYESELSGRLELAEDVLRLDNPFTRRVIVNRVWHHLFGQGLVPTVDNFGRLGEKPSHPELLDYLATRFSAEDEWSLKSLIRFLVLSDAWQRDSRPSELAKTIDPDNRLLSHFSVRRLEAEAIRDSLLAVSGQLDYQMFGEPIMGGTPRRSVYMRIKRNNLDPFLSVFDAPTPFATKGRRDSTNVPAQSLTLLNDPFVINASKELAERVKEDSSLRDDAARVSRLWQLALGRQPRESEEEMISAFIDQVGAREEEVSRELAEIHHEIERGRKETAAILGPVLEKLERENAKEETAATQVQLMPEPVSYWDFEDDFRDGFGKLHGKERGQVEIENGALVLNGDGFVATETMEKPLREKTMDVLVELQTLDQTGGGAMTVQDLRGAVFDSIVFAERYPKQWVAGSNNFRRSTEFDAEWEDAAVDRPVRVTLAYDSDGTIRGYRDGRPYG